MTTTNPALDTNQYDLIVVGASLAGLVAARAASQRGLKTAIIDQQKTPGARIRGNGILVKEAAEEINLPPELTRSISGVRMYAPNCKHIDLYSKDYFLVATDTPALMQWLAEDAQKAGVQLFFNTHFQSASHDGDFVRLHGLDLSARYILGADGAKSRVARNFDLGLNKEFLVGLETEYNYYDGISSDHIHCFIDSALAPGYLGWMIPGVGTTQIGLAVSPTLSGKPRQPDYFKFLAKIHPLFPGLLDLKEKVRRSGPIPCGGLVHPISTHKVLLTGDAAGLVSPLTAGGMRLAFQFGRRAGLAIAGHLLEGKADPGILMAKEYPNFIRKTMLRRAWSLAPANPVMNAILFTPPMQALARRIYFQTKLQIPANLLPILPQSNGQSAPKSQQS